MYSIMLIYISYCCLLILFYNFQRLHIMYKKKRLKMFLNKMESNINLVKSTYFIYDTDIETDLNIFAPRVKRASVY